MLATGSSQLGHQGRHAVHRHDGVITGVSGLVHLYSSGYMSDDPHKSRFFAYLSLFTFAMLMLVTADNLCSCSSAGKAWASPPTC
jgi:hypothetical protein